MRVLVCGGRSYSNYDNLSAYMDRHFTAHLSSLVIIHGAATGADAAAGRWAKSRGLKPEEFPAAWDDLEAPGAVIRKSRGGKLYNVRAGFDRNQRMVDQGKPDLVVAFPGGNGTADMVQRAEKAGVKVDLAG